MFGLNKTNRREGDSHSPRRQVDRETSEAEVAVLRALQNSARRSSPHSAAVRADLARAIAVVEAAMLGLSQIRELVDEAEGLCRSALETEHGTRRALIAERYRNVMVEINAIANATGHNGVNLIDDSASTITVKVADGQEIRLRLPHIVLTTGSGGLALPRASRAFGSTSHLKELLAHLSLARSRLDKAASSFQEHASDLAKRLAFVLDGTVLSADELRDVPDAPMARRS